MTSKFRAVQFWVKWKKITTKSIRRTSLSNQTLNWFLWGNGIRIVLRPVRSYKTDRHPTFCWCPNKNAILTKFKDRILISIYWSGQNFIREHDKPFYQENSHVFFICSQIHCIKAIKLVKTPGSESINLVIKRFKVLILVKKETSAVIDFYNCIHLSKMNLAGLVKEGYKSRKSSGISLLSLTKQY